MPADRIAIRLVGLSSDGGDVRVKAFIKKLEALKSSVKVAEKLVLSSPGQFDYTVVDLSHSSPATVKLGVIPLSDEAAEMNGGVGRAFYQIVEAINTGGGLPPGVEYEDLRKFRGLEPRKNETPEVSVISGNRTLKLSGDWSENIESLLGPDELEEGSVVGRLEQVNVHGRNRTFHIYPTMGEPSVRCEFSEKQREQVVRALDHYVEVFGTLTFKAKSLYPYHMLVDRIEVFPREAQLPTLEDFSGVAPRITYGATIEDYLQEERNGWDD